MNQTKITHEVRVERSASGANSVPLADVRRAVNAAVAEVKKTGDGSLDGWRVHELALEPEGGFSFRSTVGVVAKRTETRQ